MRPKLPIARLLKAQRRWEKTLRKVTATSRKFITKPPKIRRKKEKLVEISTFGSNPGNLRMLTYVPPLLPARAPLVVVLHGCFADGARLRRGQRLVAAGQAARLCLLSMPNRPVPNNPNRCFNWFQSPRCPTGLRRGVVDPPDGHPHATEPQHRSLERIFITGLSAGRRPLASVMLATYPEVFLPGVWIIAGLPYGAVSGMRQVMHVMKRPQSRPTVS